MARQKDSVDDNEWPEVFQINSYAIFMGYLFMGMKGLGLLMFTWTTVVLLGGFVSNVEKKDFWCLTVIALVQTAGVFDFLLKDKVAIDVVNSLNGLLAALNAVMVRPFENDTKTSLDSSKVIKEDKEPWTLHSTILVALWVVQVLSFAVVLCPVAVLYLFGLVLSAGISSWRLIQHDYGNPRDGGTNLKSALNVLYFLAIAQGLVYLYWTIFDGRVRTRLVKAVADHYSLEIHLVWEYVNETMVGCMKDPSFAEGRNLVTYAVDLMESKSRCDYISAVLILGKIHEPNHFDSEQCDLIMNNPRCPIEQSSLMKELLTGSSSFNHVVHRLLETFGPRSPYNIEIRVRAARIVANVAASICLEQFPAQAMMMQCISSLLDTSDYSWRPEGYERRQLRRPVYVVVILEKKKRMVVTMENRQLPNQYERDWLLDNREVRYSGINRIPSPKAAETQESDNGSLRLVVQGLCILQGLAINEDNCIVISKTQGLLPKAIAPLVSDQHQPHSDSCNHHGEWPSMARESLELIKRLMDTPGTETKLPSEISGNNQAIIRAIEAIVECRKCEVLLKRQAGQVLLHLCPDTPPSTMFVWILLHISLMPDYHFDRMCGSTYLAKKSSDTKRLAGEKLQAIRSVGDVIYSLATAVADTENNTYIRIHAATILKHLVCYYTKDDTHLEELKETMTYMMPEVLKQIVVAQHTIEAETQTVTEALNALQAVDRDLEQGSVSHDNGQESSSTSHQQMVEQHQRIIELQEALLHLCRVINFTWILKDQDLTNRFNEIAANICLGQGMPDKTFVTLVYQAQRKLGQAQDKLSSPVKP